MTIGPEIKIENLNKSYGSTRVIEGLNASIPAGSFTVILGPSGCGKSTLLNMLAGLEEVSSGVIKFADEEVQAKPASKRGCAMVFQNYALYPHMSVAQNIGYSLKLAKVPKAERLARVTEAARMVSLSDWLDRKPSQLSGGQRQRVAIARAIVREPAVLLFDEPLSNLDAKLRHKTRIELSELHKRIGATSVFVTHDQVEAMTLADQIMVLNGGYIEQFGTPSEIYNQPASTFVASFIGAPPMNLLQATGNGRSVLLGDGTRLVRSALNKPVTIGLRPEKIVMADDGIEVKPFYQEDLGSHNIVSARLLDGQEINFATKQTIKHDRVYIKYDDADLHLFDSKTGKRLKQETA